MKQPKYLSLLDKWCADRPQLFVRVVIGSGWDICFSGDVQRVEGPIPAFVIARKGALAISLFPDAFSKKRVRKLRGDVEIVFRGNEPRGQSIVLFPLISQEQR